TKKEQIRQSKSLIQENPQLLILHTQTASKHQYLQNLQHKLQENRAESRNEQHSRGRRKNSRAPTNPSRISNPTREEEKIGT
uniref:Uncharacterized protein n=1 Tax=Triticum urartu TaxID=4572 RepID=A0A8R7UG34_TRIUA